MRRVVLAVAIALICALSAAGTAEVYSLVAPAHADTTGGTVVGNP
jgi:hypothetical protein